MFLGVLFASWEVSLGRLASLLASFSGSLATGVEPRARLRSWSAALLFALGATPARVGGETFQAERPEEGEKPVEKTHTHTHIVGGSGRHCKPAWPCHDLFPNQTWLPGRRVWGRNGCIGSSKEWPTLSRLTLRFGRTFADLERREVASPGGVYGVCRRHDLRPLMS